MKSTSVTATLNWVGIDVSKDKLDIYELATQSFSTFNNDLEGIDRLKQHLATQENLAVVCESTGGYESLMALNLHHAAIRISVVNPRPVRDFAKAMSQLAKTDALDAYVLAQCCDDHADLTAAFQNYQVKRYARVSRAISAANANARNYHLNGIQRRVAHTALRGMGRFAPDAFLRRLSWLYDYDVTA